MRKNQTESGNLARIMFMQRRSATWARDKILKHMPERSATAQIVEPMRSPL